MASICRLDALTVSSKVNVKTSEVRFSEKETTSGLVSSIW